MNDDEFALVAQLSAVLSVSESDRERLSTDMARRIQAAERDELLWQVFRTALGSFHEQVNAIRSHSQARAFSR